MRARLRLRPRQILFLGVLAVCATDCAAIWNFQDFEAGGDASADAGGSHPDAPVLGMDTGAPPVDAGPDVFDATMTQVIDAGDAGDASDARAAVDANEAGGCPPGTHLCTGQCVTDTDIMNCGSACVRCIAPLNAVSQSCTNGVCTASCGGGSLTLCDGGGPNGACVDLTTNSEDCGRCGHVCPSPTGGGGAVCIASACGVACAGGLTACPPVNPTSCVNLATDSLNCGGCGNTCTNDAGGPGRCVDAGCQ